MATRRHALLIRPVAKIPQCSSLTSHNAPFCNIFVTKWCIVGYLPGASWDLWDGSITEYQVEILIKQNCRFFQVLIKEIRHCRKLSLNLHQCIWQGIRVVISTITGVSQCYLLLAWKSYWTHNWVAADLRRSYIHRQVVHPRHQQSQGEWVAIYKHGTLLLITLSLACSSDIKGFHGNMSNPLFGKKVREQKPPWMVDECVNSMQGPVSI